MSKQLKTRFLEVLAQSKMPKNQLSSLTPHSRGVRYFIPVHCIKSISGALDTVKHGQKHKARIVVRPSRHYPQFHEIYTYHFPEKWSEGCVKNRELIKLAQRMAHAIERDRSYASIQWRIQFIKQLHNPPSPDTKIYPHFFQYVFVSIYRSLRATTQNIEQNSESTTITSEPDFEPIQKNIRKKSCIFQKKAVPLQPQRCVPGNLDKIENKKRQTIYGIKRTRSSKTSESADHAGHGH